MCQQPTMSEPLTTRSITEQTDPKIPRPHQQLAVAHARFAELRQQLYGENGGLYVITSTSATRTCVPKPRATPTKITLVSTPMHEASEVLQHTVPERRSTLQVGRMCLKQLQRGSSLGLSRVAPDEVTGKALIHHATSPIFSRGKKGLASLAKLDISITKSSPALYNSLSSRDVRSPNSLDETFEDWASGDRSTRQKMRHSLGDAFVRVGEEDERGMKQEEGLLFFESDGRAGVMWRRVRKVLSGLKHAQ